MWDAGWWWGRKDGGARETWRRDVNTDPHVTELGARKHASTYYSVPETETARWDVRSKSGFIVCCVFKTDTFNMYQSSLSVSCRRYRYRGPIAERAALASPWRLGQNFERSIQRRPNPIRTTTSRHSFIQLTFPFRPTFPALAH
jgi:hypothetical protein